MHYDMTSFRHSLNFQITTEWLIIQRHVAPIVPSSKDKQKQGDQHRPRGHYVARSLSRAGVPRICIAQTTPLHRTKLQICQHSCPTLRQRVTPSSKTPIPWQRYWSVLLFESRYHKVGIIGFFTGNFCIYLCPL